MMNGATQEPPESTSEAANAPRELRFANSASDWAIRAVFFLIFLYFGTAKLKAGPESPWGVIFGRIGLGQWFRYFTGVLEALGAFLILVPGAVEIGLAVLMTVAIGATISTIFILKQMSGAFVPFALLCGMIAFWMHRRRV